MRNFLGPSEKKLCTKEDAIIRIPCPQLVVYLLTCLSQAKKEFHLVEEKCFVYIFVHTKSDMTKL